MSRRLAVMALVAAALPSMAEAQPRPALYLVWETGDSVRVDVGTERGYAAVSLDAMARLGWTVSGGATTPGAAAPDADQAVLSGPNGTTVEFRAASPYFRWGGQPLQLVDPAYRDGGAFMVPVQFVSDFLPRRLPDLYAFEGGRMVLHTATGAPDATGPTRGPAAPAFEAAAPPVTPPPVPEAAAPAPVTARPSAYDGTRVVIIDAGHGGDDPGSISRAGLREKVVALGVARAIAARLRERPDIEVHMIRDDDTFVSVWSRGAMATELKGDRPGVFVSVHANSFNSPARGFETYFLSDARTEHERRVAAIENAPVREVERGTEAEGDLGFILRELRNFDHAHWSAFLAGLVQEEMDPYHPGPNRGVKQAPLAVLTNALMPSVLVEVGYLSHAEEARLLGRADFQRNAGHAIADAIVRFFERFPPGAGTGAGEGS